jgi:hypothetical protein
MVIKLSTTPPWKLVEEVYGNPDKDGDDEIDKDWYETRTEWYKLPFTMVAPWSKDRMYHWIRVHRLVGPAMIDALREIGEHYGPSIVRGTLNVLGGTLCLRPMKSSPYLSMHAYGVAIDINNQVACWGCEPDTQPEPIVAAFESRGFVWGGRWKEPYKDPMHFQAVGG